MTDTLTAAPPDAARAATAPIARFAPGPDPASSQRSSRGTAGGSGGRVTGRSGFGGGGARAGDAQGDGKPSRVNRPSTLTFCPSTSMEPPDRRSTTMSQCRPLSLRLPVSG